MNILCYGDSNTYGYDPADGMRYSEDVRWPCVLRELLTAEQGSDEKKGAASGTLDPIRLIEEGCNGRTASCCPEDEPWKDGRPYLPACLNSHKPLDLVIVMLGSNDLKRMFRATPESITAGIREILQTIADFTMLKQGYRPQVLLLSPPWIGEGIAESPFADRFDEDAVGRSQRLARLYAEAAEDFTRSGQLDCGFLDTAKVCRASGIDSLHLDPEGHAAIAEAVEKWICRQGKQTRRQGEQLRQQREKAAGTV